MNQIAVLLVEDHALVRKEIRALLETDEGVEVVGEAHNGREGVELARKFHPAVVLMDIAMPELNGFEATRQILKASPDTRVLFLSAYDDEAYVDHALALGASGYLLKQSSATVLSTAIREGEKGKPFFSPSISKRLGEKRQKPMGRTGLSKPRKVALSPRAARALREIIETAS